LTEAGVYMLPLISVKEIFITTVIKGKIVSGTFSIGARSAGLLALVFFTTQLALSETCAECQRKVQADMNTCAGQLPRVVKYANPGKPTDAERQAAADRLEKSRACSTKAREGFANCRQTASCP